MLKITDKIKNLRKEKGISQGNMANTMEISRPTYIQIEKGNKDLQTGKGTKITVNELHALWK